MRSAVSQLLVKKENDGNEKKTGVLQRFRSLGEHLHITGSPSHNEHSPTICSTKKSSKNTTIEHCSRAISTSTGYLNVKDVFLFPGSITTLPEYKQDQQRFRSVSSLQQHDKLLTATNSIQKITIHEIQQDINNVNIGDGKTDLNRESKIKVGCEVGKEENGSSTSATRAIEIWR